MASDADFELVEGAVWPLLHRSREFEESPHLLESLSPGQRMLFATHLLEMEVRNGGFSQFYFNGGGYAARYAVAGYEMLGAPEQAALARRAVEIAQRELGGPPPILDPPPRDVFEAFRAMRDWSSLKDLDDPWYEAERRVDLCALKAEYVRRHAKEFPL